MAPNNPSLGLLGWKFERVYSQDTTFFIHVHAGIFKIDFGLILEGGFSH